MRCLLAIHPPKYFKNYFMDIMLLMMDGRVSSEDLAVKHSNRYYKFYISSAIFLTKVNKKFLNMLYKLLYIVCQLPTFIDLI